MINLKEFKQLVTTSPLITIYNAPVKFSVEMLFVSLEWRGLETGNIFAGGVNSENLAEAKFVSNNTIAVRLAYLDAKGNVHFNSGYTPIAFWHKIEVPIIHG